MMPPSSERGLIIRQKQPANPETPLDQVSSFLTPGELFYVRVWNRPGKCPRKVLRQRRTIHSNRDKAILRRTTKIPVRITHCGPRQIPAGS
jgi:hypothetical protein